MRLIDADEVIKAVNELMIVDKTVMSFVLMNAATVDAVEVVRCKDCKFYYRMTAETGICQLACPHFGNDGFCSEGERKDGDL